MEFYNIERMKEIAKSGASRRDEFLRELNVS